MKYNTYTGDPIIHNNKKVTRGQLLSPAACMLINRVSNDACQNALYVAWHTKKSWAFSDLVAVISAALHKTFVRSKYADSASQFLLYWIRIIFLYL